MAGYELAKGLGLPPARDWAVGDLLRVHAEWWEVMRITIYMPNTHPASPVADDLWAVEAITTGGILWSDLERTQDEMDRQRARENVQDAARECRQNADRAVALEDLFDTVWRCEREADREAAIDAACYYAR